MPSSTTKENWKAEVAKVIVPGIVGAMSAISVAYFTQANQSRELDLKMVDTALAILAGEKGGDESADNRGYVISRTYALRALKQYAQVDISDDEISEWARSGALQSGAFQGFGSISINQGSTPTLTNSVLLASFRTLEEASKSAEQLTAEYSDIFEMGDLQTQKVDLGSRGVYYRVYFSAGSQLVASEVCNSLKERGADCVVF